MFRAALQTPRPRAQAQLLLSRALEHNTNLPASCTTQGNRFISSSSSSQTPTDGGSTTTSNASSDASASSSSTTTSTIPSAAVALSTSPIESNTQRPIRARVGGQNLFERYKRLERSVRGKEALARFKSAAISSDSTRSLSGNGVATSAALSSRAMYFRGFEVPQEPHPPQSDECCMSSCAVCVYDLYDESLTAYRNSLAHLRISLRDAGIPESEWPTSIQTSTEASRPKTHHEVAMSAFEEMERRLQEKKQSAAEDARTAIPPSRSKQYQNPKPLKNLHEAYEGMKWVLFSNR